MFFPRANVLRAFPPSFFLHHCLTPNCLTTKEFLSLRAPFPYQASILLTFFSSPKSSYPFAIPRSYPLNYTLSPPKTDIESHPPKALIYTRNRQFSLDPFAFPPQQFFSTRRRTLPIAAPPRVLSNYVHPMSSDVIPFSSMNTSPRLCVSEEDESSSSLFSLLSLPFPPPPYFRSPALLPVDSHTALT